MGMLLTWEKVVTYLPKPPDFGNIRDGHTLSQLLLLNQTFRILPLCIEPTRDARNVTGHTGTLGGLVGSLNKAGIYPAYAIHCKRLWSMPALIPGLSDIRW